MKLLRKQQFIYTVKYANKIYTFVTNRNLIQQKIWFDKIHDAQCRYDNISYVKIPQSRYDSTYLTHLFI